MVYIYMLKMYMIKKPVSTEGVDMAMTNACTRIM